MPSYKFLIALADSFQVSLDYLTGRSTTRGPADAVHYVSPVRRPVRSLRELTAFLAGELGKIDADCSVLIQDLASGKAVFDFNSHKQMVSASIIKTPVMLTALELVRRGELRLEQEIPVDPARVLDDTKVFDRGEPSYSLEELLTWMITTSDNTATNTLMDLLTMERVNAWCEAQGLTATVLQRKMLDWEAIHQGRNNYTSAADQCILFTALYRESILTPSLCALALDILKRQRWNDLAMRYIADRVPVAHKTGGLDHLNHDAGIVFLPDRPYYFGFFAANDEQDASPRLIGRLSKAVYEYMREQ